jgi:SAM-dependent methyltransferase
MPLANGYLDSAECHDDEPRYPLDVISCRNCRLMSLTYVVDPAILYRNYLYVTSDSDTITQHMRYVTDLCRQQLTLRPGELVVEIGSNTGAQLRLFKDAGMRTLGIDPARNLAAVARANGIETLSEFFTLDMARLVADQYGPARLVLARHVFAHIDDVAAVATAISALLSRDGEFVIEIPYAVDLLERVAFDTIYHEHLSYFSVRTLVTLFERHNLEVRDVRRLPVHGGSILVFVGLMNGKSRVRPAVAKLLDLEQRIGLDDDVTYLQFARDVKRIRDELRSLIRGLVAEGKTVAGYGAPAKGNTIMNFCGLGTGEVAFCSDTTRLKQGKLLPGTHIPIISPEQAREAGPDYYLLLAWNYAEEIVAKERSFLAGGGRFIVPIPRPAVISTQSDLSAWSALGN